MVIMKITTNDYTEFLGNLFVYCQISNIRHTKHAKSQNLNVWRFILQLSLPNPLKPGV